MDSEENEARHVVGGVDTHKDMHVAAVVDDATGFSQRNASPRPARVTGR